MCLWAGTAGQFQARQVIHLRAELEMGYWAVGEIDDDHK